MNRRWEMNLMWAAMALHAIWMAVMQFGGGGHH